MTDKEIIDYEFEMRKNLIELEKESKMETLKYIRDTERLKHEWELERTRIKTAEIRKNIERNERVKSQWQTGNTY